MRIKSEAEYDRAVGIIINCEFNKAVDCLGYRRLSTIKNYELEKGLTSKTRAVKTFNALFKFKKLKQRELSMVGSQGVVSEILSGKRGLTVKQVDVLAKHFNINPYIFL